MSKAGLLPGDTGQAVPAWFRWATAQAPKVSMVQVAGANIEAHVWGRRGQPGLLLVPGSRAHAHWWGFFAPFFAGQFRVAALSLSGMGESDHRETYSTPQFADEAMAVAEHAGLFDCPIPPLFMGVSMAGLALVHCGVRHGQRLRGLLLADTLLRAPAGQPARGTAPAPAHKIYATREEAMSRFRLFPQPPLIPSYVLDFLAGHSVKPAPGGGWTWRYDANLVTALTWHDEEDLLPDVRCPVALLRGETSTLVTPEVFDAMRGRLPHRTPALHIPGAGHHLLAEQPLALISSVRGLLTCWPDEATLPNIAEA